MYVRVECEVLNAIYLIFENSQSFTHFLPADIRVSKPLVTRFYISVVLHTDSMFIHCTYTSVADKIFAADVFTLQL